MDFTSLAGVMALFATKGGMVVGWVHYLAFDLFAGMWIARDADQKSFSRVVQFPFLVLKLMAGPVGLLAWLIVRARRARALARTRLARAPGSPPTAAEEPPVGTASSREKVGQDVVITRVARHSKKK